MKATLFTEKRSSNLGSLLRKHSYGGSFDSTPNPTSKTLISIAQILDVTIDELLPPPWPDLRTK